MNTSLKALIGAMTLMASIAASGQRAIEPREFALYDEDFYPRDTAKERLGQLLMFDKILSGNQNIACATCHHPFVGTGDGLSLPIGEGGRGLSVSRDTGSGLDAVHERVPRNAPALFNVGAHEFAQLFFDGRVAVDASQPSGFLSPAGDDLPLSLDNVLAAQAMFPVTSGTEMAGQAGENAIADAAAAGDLVRVWSLIAERLQAIPAYVDLFIAAFPDIDHAADMTYAHAANAIAAFEATAFRCTNAAFDRFVANGEVYWDELSETEKRGGWVFYVQASCADCHRGPFQTDHDFHAIGIPQIGPGKGDSLPGFNDGHDDFGREQVSGNPADRFKFRTPSLRQVAQTGPWGHSGAYNDLETMVRHHLNAVEALYDYDTRQAVLPARSDLDALDFIALQNPNRRQAIAEAIELTPVALTQAEFDDLMVFLTDTLTDHDCLDLRNQIPAQVPSGLPVAD